MAYTPYTGAKRINFDPVLTAGLLENILSRVTDLNSRLAPLESNYVALAANAGGAVNTNEVQRDTIDALQDQIIALSAYVTDTALSTIPLSTATSYANFPPFAVRAFAIENRLNVIGA
jgi:hypothetical protein